MNDDQFNRIMSMFWLVIAAVGVAGERGTLALVGVLMSIFWGVFKS